MIHLKTLGTIYGTFENPRALFMIHLKTSCKNRTISCQVLFQNATLLQNMLQNMQHVL